MSPIANHPASRKTHTPFSTMGLEKRDRQNVPINVCQRPWAFIMQTRSANEARGNVYRLMDQAAESHQAITGLSSEVFQAVN